VVERVGRKHRPVAVAPAHVDRVGAPARAGIGRLDVPIGARKEVDVSPDESVVADVGLSRTAGIDEDLREGGYCVTDDEQCHQKLRATAEREPHSVSRQKSRETPIRIDARDGRGRTARRYYDHGSGAEQAPPQSGTATQESQ